MIHPDRRMPFQLLEQGLRSVGMDVPPAAMTDLRENKLGGGFFLVGYTEKLRLAFDLSDLPVTDDVGGEVLADLPRRFDAVGAWLQSLFNQHFQWLHLACQAAAQPVAGKQYSDTTAYIQAFEKRLVTRFGFVSVCIRNRTNVRTHMVDGVIARDNAKSGLGEHLVEQLSCRPVEPGRAIDRIADDRASVENVLAQRLDMSGLKLQYAHAADEQCGQPLGIEFEVFQFRLGLQIGEPLGSGHCQKRPGIPMGQIPVVHHPCLGNHLE